MCVAAPQMTTHFTLAGGPPSDTLGRFVPRSRRAIGPFSRGLLRHSRPPLRSRLLRCLAGRCFTAVAFATPFFVVLLAGVLRAVAFATPFFVVLLAGVLPRLPSRRPSSLSCWQVPYRARLLLGRRRTKRDGSPGTRRRSRAARGSARSCVRTTEDREGPRCGNEDGLVTRRPLNGDHATPNVGHDAASGRLVHLGAHHLNLVTDFWHKSLLTTLVGQTSVDLRSSIANFDGIPTQGTRFALAPRIFVAVGQSDADPREVGAGRGCWRNAQ